LNTISFTSPCLWFTPLSHPEDSTASAWQKTRRGASAAGKVDAVVVHVSQALEIFLSQWDVTDLQQLYMITTRWLN